MYSPTFQITVKKLCCFIHHRLLEYWLKLMETLLDLDEGLPQHFSDCNSLEA